MPINGLTDRATLSGKLINVPDRKLIDRLVCLKKAGYVGPSTVSFYLSCPPPNGDMAMDAFDREFEYMCEEAPVHPLIDDIEQELKRRGVDWQDVLWQEYVASLQKSVRQSEIAAHCADEQEPKQSFIIKILKGVKKCLSLD